MSCRQMNVTMSSLYLCVVSVARYSAAMLDTLSGSVATPSNIIPSGTTECSPPKLGHGEKKTIVIHRRKNKTIDVDDP